MSERDVVIVSAARTAMGNFNGTLKNTLAVDLGALVIQEVIKRAKVDPKLVDEVILGNVLQAGLGQNTARQASLKGNLPIETPAMTINKVCGSGMKAVHLAAQAILLGDAEVMVAGGMENMSQAPYLSMNARSGLRMGDQKFIDSMIHDGLWSATDNYHMGITAENIAEKYNLSREKQDEFSAWSQQKAEKAIADGKFKDEIVPVEIPQRRGDPIIFDTDEFVRPGTTAESLGKLRPAFKKDGTVTAGNASGINDGASAMLIMSRKKANELGLKPMAKVRSYANAAVEPSIMGMGPVPATQNALKKAGLSLSDINLIEANEAFAAQALGVDRELKFNHDILNVNGGAIALGHPIGASGNRIMVTLLYEMIRRDNQFGLATLCIGGGQGVATILERE